jgi:hypothetical protein
MAKVGVNTHPRPFAQTRFMIMSDMIQAFPLLETNAHTSNRSCLHERPLDGHDDDDHQGNTSAPRREGAAPLGLSHSVPRALAGYAPAGAKFLLIGPLALSPTLPSPSRARAVHRATGRLTVSGKGSVFGAGRADDGASRAPHLQPEFCLIECAKTGRRGHGVLRLTPNAQMGFGGKTVISLSSRWLSEISIAIA